MLTGSFDEATRFILVVVSPRILATLDRYSKNVHVLMVVMPELELGNIERHIFVADVIGEERSRLPPLKLDNVVRWRLDYRPQFVRPSIQRRPRLIEIAMAVVHALNALARMPDDRLGDFIPH
jgi:hypothetical protein